MTVPDSERQDEGPAQQGRAAGTSRAGRRFRLFMFTVLLLATAAGIGWFLRDRGLPVAGSVNGPRLEIERRIAALAGRLEVVESQTADLVRRVPQAGAPTDGEIDAARLAAIESQLAAAVAGLQAPMGEAAGEAAGSAGDEVTSADLTRRLADIEQRLAVLTDGAARAERVAALAQRLDSAADSSATIGSSGDGVLARQAAFAVAAAGLERAVADGRPYDQIWRTARDLALAMATGGDEPDSLDALSVLESAAVDGVVAPADLGHGLDLLARDLLAAAHAKDADGIAGRVWARLRGLVSVRRRDGAIGAGGNATPEALLAAAMEALRRDDVATAVGAVTALSGAAGGTASPAAADWLARALLRQGALAAAARLNREALSALAAAALAGGLPAPLADQP